MPSIWSCAVGPGVGVDVGVAGPRLGLYPAAAPARAGAGIAPLGPLAQDFDSKHHFL